VVNGNSLPSVCKKVIVPEKIHAVLSCAKAGYCSTDQIVGLVVNDPL
jgi:hypothetical protein